MLILEALIPVSAKWISTRILIDHTHRSPGGVGHTHVPDPVSQVGSVASYGIEIVNILFISKSRVEQELNFCYGF